MARELDPETRDAYDRHAEAMTGAADRLDRMGHGRTADGIRDSAARTRALLAEYLGELDGN